MKFFLHLLFFIITLTNSNCFVITKEIISHNNFHNIFHNNIHSNIHNKVRNKLRNNMRKNICKICNIIKCNYDNTEPRILKKIHAYNQLMRTSNAIPTFLLNILGGWLTIPSYNLFLNKNFWIFSAITQLTMMNSMVINDIFDLKIDLINNNNRPLITKQISIKEAQCLYITINIIICLLSSFFFHKNNIFLYVFGINFALLLYTPVLKKIMLIKNLTCASVVSSTLILTSKSLTYNSSPLSMIKYNDLNLLQITSIFLFLSSMYTEILLDIKDIHGDKENNIITIPNYFGVKKTIDVLLIIFTSNLMYFGNVFYQNKKYGFLLGFIFSNLSFLKNLLYLRISLLNNNRRLQYRNKNKENILKVLKETTISLIIFIITTILYS